MKTGIVGNEKSQKPCHRRDPAKDFQSCDHYHSADDGGIYGGDHLSVRAAERHRGRDERAAAAVHLGDVTDGLFPEEVVRGLDQERLEDQEQKRRQQP